MLFYLFVLSRHIASYIIRFQSLDLNRTELRKTARGASLGKPQNLLGEPWPCTWHRRARRLRYFREDVQGDDVCAASLPPLGSDTGLLLP